MLNQKFDELQIVVFNCVAHDVSSVAVLDIKPSSLLHEVLKCRNQFGFSKEHWRWRLWLLIKSSTEPATPGIFEVCRIFLDEFVAVLDLVDNDRA